MGEIDLQTREDDALASDIKGIVQLVQSFLIYVQILLTFANPAIYSELNAGLMFYVDLRIKHSLVQTFESVKGFHFLLQIMHSEGGH